MFPFLQPYANKIGGGHVPKKLFFKGPFGVIGGKKGTFGALIFSLYFTKRDEMAVYIIKTAQNKAFIMNSSVRLLLTEEYFTIRYRMLWF